ncbi:MAG: hypothetical protein HOB84_06300 [Candidatus Marinimicrobia bacterium]|jgi:hypothetical protein|nr:hypothetical protein [Candidatus Neomarinimicrobiota bacterium]MBT4361204.1 hypothetical protein [Candidatus Neomarinimicrobiota bacterium]MBT4714362.1 hypothetical protein [Candidatus Neomarinimicrobiota bacterium]MBT4945314.1 hypothetical protein [Candidatus Neomarinimicrobiota bacterium]MBT5270620.1 hypothetical protein [Candidatus Neomarinimicrobiota bacterium]
MTEEEKQPEQEEENVKSDRGSKLMGDMMKGLRDFGSAAMDKAEEYGKIASEKAEELTKLGKIKLDIHQLNRSRTKNLTELGELVFNLGEDKKLKDLAKHENYVVLIKSIKDLDIEIKEKEAQAETVEIEEGSEDKG